MLVMDGVGDVEVDANADVDVADAAVDHADNNDADDTGETTMPVRRSSLERC